MRKEGQTVEVENADDVMKANSDLPKLHEKYLDAKRKVRSLRDVIVAHLDTDVASRLEELQNISDAEHHQLYCKKFDERLKKTIEICSETSNEEVSKLVRGNTFAHHRSKPSGKMNKSYSTLGLQRNSRNAAGNIRARSLSGYEEKDAE